MMMLCNGAKFDNDIQDAHRQPLNDRFKFLQCVKHGSVGLQLAVSFRSCGTGST